MSKQVIILTQTYSKLVHERYERTPDCWDKGMVRTQTKLLRCCKTSAQHLHQTLFIATLLSAHSVCPTGKYKLNKIPRHRLPCSTVLHIRLETSLAFFVLPVAWPAGADHNTGELTGKTGFSSGHREVNSKSGFRNTAR